MPTRRRTTAIETLESRTLMASIAVTSTADSGAGSLRNAITAALPGDVIDLTGLSGTITLSSQIVIEKDLTLNGPGRDELSISGNDANRIFQIAASVNGCSVSISDMTLTDGLADNGYGGAIYVYYASTLALNGVTIENSSATIGGAIADGSYNNTLNCTDTLIINNTATSSGGGVSFGGTATFNRTTVAYNSVTAPVRTVPGDATMSSALGGGLRLYTGNFTLTNSTVANNSVASAEADERVSNGGGILVSGNSQLELLNTTITANTTDLSDSAAGLGQGSGTLLYAVTNTIIAGNSGGPDVVITSPDFNSVVFTTLVGRMSSTYGFTDGWSGNQVGTDASPIDPKLATLALYEGVLVARPLADSPARDGGTDIFAPFYDQANQLRDANSDLGSVEFRNTAPAFVTTTISAAAADALYVQTVTATDADTSDTLAITAVAKPDWLSVVPVSNGTIELRGTPALADVGDAEITLQLSDGTTSVFETFELSFPTPSPASVDENGLLTVWGTTSADSISVWVRPGNQLRVVRNGVIRNFVASSVLQVQIKADAGNDTVAVNMVGPLVRVEGGTGADTLTGGAEMDYFYGGAGNDVLNGGEGADRLEGNDDDDIIYGGGGRNRIIGGDGSDLLVGGSNRDFLYGDAGFDSIYGGRHNDVIYGGADNDQLFGQLGNDLIYGNEGNDLIYGHAGIDSLYGDADDDTLYARDSRFDLLVGGLGTDAAQVDAGETGEYESVLA